MPTKPSHLVVVLGLVVSLALAFGVAGIGGAATAQSVHDWYPSIAKPSWTPPAWVFAPVWTTLYLLMAIAAWLVWLRRGTQAGAASVRVPLTCYVVQLALNAVWSILFFGLHSPGAAAVEILFLWSALVATVVTFHRVRPFAAWLLAPYLVWSSFAAALNWTVWWLNRG